MTTDPILAFLDAHLAILYLATGSSHQDKEDVRLLPYLSSTRMIDYTNKLTLLATGSPIPGFAAKREAILTALTSTTASCQSLLHLLSSHAEQLSLHDRSANLAVLSSGSSCDLDESIKLLYDLAILQYDVGSYSAASESLFHYGVLSGNQDKILSAHWGKLAADTLDSNWDACLEDINALSHAIEARHFPHQIALQQRACLIHWSLFAFFSTPSLKGIEAMVDLCLDPLYANTIQVVCPWLLSPLAVAVLLSKRKGALKEYVRVTALDPAPVPLLVSFLRTLSGQASDEVISTQKTIALFKECLILVRADRFMSMVTDAFIERVHAMLFESYVKLYHVIHIPTVISMLELTKGQDGERWIVDMLQGMKLDATIDEVANTITVHSHPSSIYQSIIEKTKSHSFRASLCAYNLEKREAELLRLTRSAASADQEESPSLVMDESSPELVK